MRSDPLAGSRGLRPIRSLFAAYFLCQQVHRISHESQLASTTPCTRCDRFSAVAGGRPTFSRLMSIFERLNYQHSNACIEIFSMLRSVRARSLEAQGETGKTSYAQGSKTEFRRDCDVRHSSRRDARHSLPIFCNMEWS